MKLRRRDFAGAAVGAPLAAIPFLRPAAAATGSTDQRGAWDIGARPDYRLAVAAQEVELFGRRIQALLAGGTWPGTAIRYSRGDRFRVLAESLPDYAICLLDSGGRVMGWNPAAERVLGYGEPEIRGQSYSRFFTREDLLARRPERLLSLAHFSGRAINTSHTMRPKHRAAALRLWRAAFKKIGRKGVPRQSLPGIHPAV